MAGQGPMSPTYGTFESLQSHTSSLRRTKPPDIKTFVDENRVPLRADAQAEKISKRDSRVGLRSIFGRSKTGKDGKEVEGTSSLRDRPTSIRASLAEISNWPYGLHSPRSDMSLSLTSPPPTSSRSTSSALQSPAFAPRLKQQASNSRVKSSQAADTTIPRRSPAATWTPPPLFQVYPQAVKYTTLPACTAPIDVLLRLSDMRNTALHQDDQTEHEEVGERKLEKGRRRHQRSGSRSMLGWTSKIYLLVTSGYLLQYAAEGTFDRLPEKILQLSKDSAAFASDLIPGKHWVLQISSSMDADGTPNPDSKSLFSKLSLRASEKRNASNFLMVFESAEDMESWLATLRRQIEALGGKKKLTETGKPKTEEAQSKLQTQPSQRTLVVRDPERFSNTIVTQDFSWTPRNNTFGDNTETLSGFLPTETAPEFVLDDVSTTESHYSSDGQRLDSLRDSGNRLSFISSGARTIMTSAGSSPACSPIRPSFPNLPEEPQESQAEVRLRPNAQAIANRRQSMQTVLPGFDVQIDSHTRPHSINSNAAGLRENNQNQFNSNRQSVPNFSIPHGTNRRLSALRPSPLDSLPNSTQVSSPETHQKSIRKSPPTALAMSRPLSIVVDQPSPLCSPNKDVLDIQTHSPTEKAPESPSLFSSWVQNVAQPVATARDLPSRCSSLSSELQPPPLYHVRNTSQSSTKANDSSGWKNSASSPLPDAPRFILPTATLPHEGSGETRPEVRAEMSTFMSPITDHFPELRHSNAPVSKFTLPKRASLLAETSPSLSRLHSITNFSELNNQDEERPPSPPLRSSKRLARATVTTSTKPVEAAAKSKSLLNRRSMPQLADGPPPIPPPTCALPPIPSKHQDSINRPPRSIRA